MEDRALVAALVSGDPRGLEGAYRAYADRLYTYCRAMVRDPDTAADAVHDTFLLASQRAGQLREPERLRSWLYAIARNECLRSLRGRARQVPLAEAGDVSAPTPDPTTGIQAEQVRELVWAAVAGLNPGDREVLELALRHDLAAAEIAAMLGMSTAHAHARLSRARAQLERSLGALLVARTGAQECAALAEVLRGWDGELTALVRKRVSRHIESCDVCADRQRTHLRPAALFSAYAAAPLLIAPVELWPRLRLTSTDAAHQDTREEVEHRAGRFEPGTGFPFPLDLRRRRRRLLGVAAVAVAALLAATAGATLPYTGADPDALAAPTSAAPGTPAAPAGSPSVNPPSPSPGSPSPSPTVTASEPAPPPPPPPPRSPSPSAALEVAASAEFACGLSGTVLAVTAQASGVLQSATLFWQIESEEARTAPMVLDGASAAERISLGRLQRVTWWVEVVTPDGRAGETEPVAESCPVPQ